MLVPMMTYVILVAVHALAYEVEWSVGEIVDVAIALGIAIFALLRLLPGLLDIVREYNRCGVKHTLESSVI
jgi:hypothetical protein